MRLFVCVSPDEASARTLAAFMGRLRGFPGYKWVAPENLHVTLLFLGESDGAQVQRIDSELSRLGGIRPFAIKISGAGAFPNLSRPKTIWLGVREGAGELEKLGAKVARAAKGAGFASDDKKFKAHLTLARARGDGGAMPEDLKKSLDDAPAVSWTCDRFTLMKSLLTPKGPIYTPIRTYEL